MGYVETIVRSAVDGEAVKAHIAECSDCGCRAFHVFQIHGHRQDHWHMQCYRCGVSYCCGDECGIQASLPGEVE